MRFKVSGIVPTELEAGGTPRPARAPTVDDDAPSAEEIAAAQREDADDQKWLQLLLDADEALAAANSCIKEQAAHPHP